ncbi:MAG TPA: hypothetical protein VNT75_25105, partial [Symbiobacteriaceae bacterium]|nr:hypothetical protein [Symbiobacteriaceae bacterium]
GLRLAAHVAAGSVVLPQGMGWYPVPGHQTLTFVQRNRVYDTRIWHRPAPVRLTVQGANDLTFVSNALDGAPVTGAWVVGTRWTEITGKHTRICVSPEHELQARQFDWEMGHEIAWLETLVPLGRKPAIVEVPSSLWSVQSALETRGFPGGIIVDPSFLMRMDGMRLHGHLLQMWWNTPRTEEEGEVYDVLRQFMANLYAQEVEGRSQAYVSLLRLSGDLGTQTEPGKQLLAALRDFRQGRGLAETGALLRTLYDTPAPLTYAQVARAIKGEQP